jgi:hypothetical protein
VALPGLEMEFHPETLILRIDEGISVRAIAVHVAHGLREAAIRHQDGDLMQAFRA